MKFPGIILLLLLIAGCAAEKKAATSGAEIFKADITIDGASIPVTLTLNPDKSAVMERGGAMSGTWVRDSGYLTVTLTGRSGNTINEVYLLTDEGDSITVLEHRVDGMALGSRAERFTLKK